MLRHLLIPVLIATVSVTTGCPDSGPPAAEDTFGVIEKVTGPVKLELTNDSGSTCIRKGGDGEVRFAARVRVWGTETANAQAIVARIAKTPPITVKEGVIEAGDIGAVPELDSDWLSTVAIDWQIDAPAGTTVRVHGTSGDTCVEDIAGGIKVETVSGNVTVQRAGGAVQVSTVSGDATIEGSGNALLDTVSGDILATDVTGSFSASTISGEIEATNLGGSATVETTSGDVSISGSIASATEWNVSTTSGDVTFRLPADESVHVDFDSTSGDVNSDFPLSCWFERHMTGQTSDDADALLSATTVSGDIRLQQQGK